jgi:predicted phosphodiesterase
MRQILHLGDIHGNFVYLKELIKKNDIGNNDEVTYIIQCGDFGIGFYPNKDVDTLIELNKFFEERNIIMIAIRGNHDDPFYFTGDYIYSNLKLVPDYTIMDIYDFKYLFVGGAISIDRKSRLQRMQETASYGAKASLYWYDEVFSLNEEIIEKINDIDVIVTHSAPTFCFPETKGPLVEEFARYDDALIEDLEKERQDIDVMFDILRKNGNNIRYHFYGHFHQSNITLNNYTSHYLVNINEFVELPCSY